MAEDTINKVSRINKIKITIENENSNKDIIGQENNSLGINNLIKKEDLLNPKKLEEILEDSNNNISGNYEIKECLGYGSESVVYKVINKIINKPGVMKFILIEKNGKRNFNEINILSRFKNQNIIGFYGIIEIIKNELDCIILEYAKFGTLKDFLKKVLKREYLSEQLLCYITIQILNGLKHCHKCKVAHYDLKPQNIVIDECLNVKLIDFSISYDYNRINSNKIKLPFKGTNFYMAPEVMKSKTINVKDLDKVDLFSLGVILYKFAFGFYPFGLNYEDSKDYDKVYNKMQNNPLEFNNESNCYSKYFIDFLKKLLEKDINKRININQALNHYWVKGANILLDEKEKTFYANIFLINLITDHVINFDKYINK